MWVDATGFSCFFGVLFSVGLDLVSGCCGLICFGCYGWLAADLLVGGWGVCCCGGFGVVFFVV